MDIFRILAAYLFPILAGFVVVTFCEKGKSRLPVPEKLALSFVLGSGLISLYFLHLAIAGLRFSLISIAPLIVIVLTIVISILRRRGLRNILCFTPRPALRPPGLLKGLLLALIFLLLLWKILSSGFLLVMTPTYFDDSVANWNNKAKIFYHHRSVILDREHPDYLGGYLVWYPIGVPLFKTWVHICMGRWAERAANLYTLAMYISLGIIAFYNFRRFLRPFTSLIFTYMILSVPLVTFHAGFSYVDLVVATHFLGGIAYLIRWIRERDTSAYYISALIFALGISVKNEMIPLFVSSALPAIVLYQVLLRSTARTKIMTVALYTGLAIIPHIPWMILKRFHNLSLVLPGSYREWGFYPEAFRILGNYFFDSGNYNILWLLFFSAILISLPFLLKTELKYLLLSITGALLITLSLFIVTSFFEYLKIGTTINRALLVLLPVMVFYIAAVYGKLTGEQGQTERSR